MDEIMQLGDAHDIFKVIRNCLGACKRNYMLQVTGLIILNVRHIALNQTWMRSLDI